MHYSIKCKISKIGYHKDKLSSFQIDAFSSYAIQTEKPTKITYNVWTADAKVSNIQRDAKLINSDAIYVVDLSPYAEQLFFSALESKMLVALIAHDFQERDNMMELTIESISFEA